MYKLIYKKQFATGFDDDQVVGNLAQLLQLKPKTVRLLFLSDRPCVIKVLESTTEVDQWRAAFLDAGVHLDVVSITVPDADSIADQIELELELHSLEDDEDDELESPRQFLVQKIIQQDNPEDESGSENDSKPATVNRSGEEDTKPAIETIAATPKSQAGADAPGAAAPDVATTGVAAAASVPEAEAPKAKKPKAKVAQPEPVTAPVAAETKQASVAEPDNVEAKTAALAAGPAIEVKVDTKIEPSLEAAKEIQHAPDDQAEAKAKAPAHVKVEPATKSEKKVKPVAEAKVALESTAPAQTNSATAINSAAVVETASAAKHEANLNSESKLNPEVNAQSEQSADNQESDSVVDEHPDVNFHKSSFLWGMLVILLSILLTSSIILYLKRPLWSPATVSPQSEQVVKALATEALFALAHIDVPRVQQLPDVLRPGTGLDKLPAPVDGFWQKLEQSGVDIATQLDQVWVAAYRANNQTQPLWVLTGKFNPEKITTWLKKNYVIDSESPQQLVFSSINQNTCEKSPVLMAMIESNRIVLGAPERVAAFRGRLDAAAPAEKDLADWQAISAKQMLTMALFNPAQFGDASSAIALSKLSVDANQVKGIYAGVAPRMLPPMLEFDAVMVGANQSFIENAEASITPLLANVKNSIAQDWPETLPIYERMRLSRSEQELRARIHFDEKIQAQLELWANSLLARTFAMADSQVQVAEEKLDEKPRDFVNLPSADLPSFSATKHLNPYFIAQASTGPFGVSISSVDATDQGTVITLDVAAFNLPNLGNATDNISLQVLDIVDHQDQSLLAATTSGCDTTGARQQAKINMVYEGTAVEQGQTVPYLGLQGTKKIHLPDTIALANIGAIKGELSYTLPLEVKRVKVDMPLAGKVIDAHGVQVRFLSASANRLYFQYSGNTAALLQVNALNAEGKVLATTSMRSGEGLLSTGTTTSIDLQGQVAAAEVILASKLERQTYPFSFGRIQPPEKPFVQDKPTPELLTAAALAALKQDSPPEDIHYPYQTPMQTITAGPALIAVNQLSIESHKLNLMADIYIRNQHPLTRQLSAARFVITEVEDSSGDIHSVNYQAPVAMEYSAGAWVDGKYQPDPAQPWLRGQLDLREQDLGVSDVVAFWGKLVFLAAAEPIAIPLPFQFGMQWNGAESTFKLARWEAGRLLFDIHGSFPELMGITALDENGEVVSQAAELRSSFGVNQVELPVRQRPATIEFSIARNQQTAEFPFEMRALQ